MHGVEVATSSLFVSATGGNLSSAGMCFRQRLQPGVIGEQCTLHEVCIRMSQGVSSNAKDNYSKQTERKRNISDEIRFHSAKSAVIFPPRLQFRCRDINRTRVAGHQAVPHASTEGGHIYAI